LTQRPKTGRLAFRVLCFAPEGGRQEEDDMNEIVTKIFGELEDCVR
jgi:hypothetical protein